MTSKPPLDHLYTVAEVAAALQMKPDTAYTKYLKEGWPHRKIGPKILFTKDDFEAIVKIYAQSPTPAATKRTRRTRR